MLLSSFRRRTGLALLAGLMTASIPLASPQQTAAQLNHPFAGQGVVYVLKDGIWREAFIQQVRGRIHQGQPQWIYAVRYLAGQRSVEAGISPERIRTVEQAQRQGLTDNVYDLSTQAGIDQMLAAHNQARQAVGVDALTWSPPLAASAQRWADVLLTENRFEHSPPRFRDNGTVGENLSTRRSTAVGGSLSTPARAVQGWLDERADYDYASNTCQPGKMCGHYTQMVWAETTDVGCAVARDPSARREVWVCHYAPGGNVVGQRPY